MQNKMTRGELRVIADTDHVQCGDAAAMANMLLELLGSEPVRNPVLAYADSYRELAKKGVESVQIWSVITDLERNIATLFNAPAVPVAVDEIAEQAGINPVIADAYMQGYHDSEARKTAPVAVPDELTHEEYKRRFMEEDNFDDTYRGGWNACRAAMLIAGPVTAAAVPDGWKLVPVDATRAMMDAARRVVEEGYDAMHKAMLAAAPAAPEQEV